MSFLAPLVTIAYALHPLNCHPKKIEGSEARGVEDHGRGSSSAGSVTWSSVCPSCGLSLIDDFIRWVSKNHPVRRGSAMVVRGVWWAV